MIAKHRHPGLPALIRRALAEFAPDAVLVEMSPMAQYLRHLTSVPTILTDHEAGVPDHAVTGLGAFADRRDRRLWSRYVTTEYRRASRLQAVTEEDATTISELVHRPVRRRQPALAVPRQRVRCEQAPPRALFLGDYRHHPNPEAAGRLVQQVLPRLRAAAPDAELWLAGPNHDRIQHLAAVPGVHVTGFVPELGELFAQVRVLLAPLYSGGGFRMKSLTALAHGLPVVTNQLGSRGVDAPPTARVLAETPEELAVATLRLLGSPAATAEAADAAHAWALATLDADAVAAAQIAELADLLATTPGARRSAPG
ncbi:MAG: glycosyltransferase [Planctomycetes bacterium]|nr:glycosyltransferase [Planctomycetota bacterium]